MENKDFIVKKNVKGFAVMFMKQSVVSIGIQGGKGSFNEEARRYYCVENHINDYKIKYFYTSNNVLKALHRKQVDYGQFAIQNSIGGVVRESIDALSKYNCRIIKEFEIIINHCLLAMPGARIEHIKTIMSHPQALAQCRLTLATKYSDKKVI